MQCSAVDAAPAWCQGHAQALREKGWRGKEIYGVPTARRVLSGRASLGISIAIFTASDFKAQKEVPCPSSNCS